MIPKIVHHIAPQLRKEWHPVWDKCLPSWYKHFPEPEYKHILWNDGEQINRLVKQVVPHFYNRYKKMEHIMKIDFAKIVMVKLYGGIYADMDFYCRENFYDELVKPVVLCGSFHKLEDVQNGLMAGEADHPFYNAHIDDLIEHVSTKTRADFDTFTNYIKYTTGPNSLGLTRYRNMHLDDQIQILDPEFYNPLISTFYHEGKTEGVKCMHYLSGWWGKGDRLDKKIATKSYEDWRGVRIRDIGQ